MAAPEGRSVLRLRTVTAADRAVWRSWLRKNARACSEIWLVFFKKHTRKKCCSYDEAVEEALCFGWVDSVVRRIDDDRYAQRFTPRKPQSAWSQSNVARMNELIAADMVTAAGLAAFAGHKDRPAAKGARRTGRRL